MGLPDRIFNLRAPQPWRDAVQMASLRHDMEAGPLVREWVTERLVSEAAVDCVRRVGLCETLSRLSRPTYPVGDDRTAMEDSALGQTSSNVVYAGKTGSRRGQTQ